MSKEKRFQIACGICNGMALLHSRDILHLDLKPENILISKDDIPWISDFGLRLDNNNIIDLTIKNILESTVKQRMALTELKETLLRQNSTFTERNYGFKHFRKWIIHLGFVVKTDGNEDHHYCYLSKR